MSSKETARQHRMLAQDQYKRGQYMEAMRSADKVCARNASISRWARFDDYGERRIIGRRKVGTIWIAFGEEPYVRAERLERWAG